ncbi:hypothetical protein SELMODRAFT_419927 [Selaginella moellendorffii]|uniref:Uncharacterized protein n=1 Tax=Selaginella moellendorffii TaxID=88036 RepID=D8SA11_SELML|nr:hypothetical protein SELMODRAFT_419927 [Selaginella moellendorffii]
MVRQHPQERSVRPKDFKNIKMKCIVVLVSLVLASLICINVWVPRMIKSSSSPGYYFPDLAQDHGSTCWEASYYAINNDPFYKWAIGSSLPMALKLDEKGTLGYQRASVWRISGMKDARSNGTSMFNSPDPHVLGGVLHHNDWRAVPFTAPVVWTNKLHANGTGSYPVLMVGVPYRKASSDMFSVSSSSLYLPWEDYLTNFASNARTQLGLTLDKDKGNNVNKYVYQGNVCEAFKPIFIIPDVISYLGFPTHQCGCDGNVCIIDSNLTRLSDSDQGISPLKLNSTSCNSRTSTLWNLEGIPTFSTYSLKRNGSFTFEVTFSSGSAVYFSEAMKDVNYGIIKNDCSLQGMANVDYSHSGQMIFRFPLAASGMRATFDYKVPIGNTQEDVYCGTDQGQVALSQNLCMLSMTKLKSSGEMSMLAQQLDVFANVADIKRFALKEWEKGSSKRAEVLFEILVAIFTIGATIWGMFAKSSENFEKSLIRFDWTEFQLSVLRTFARALILIGVMIWNTFSIFQMIKEVELKRCLATSGTIIQPLNGISFLVTTTSTIEVMPRWSILFWVCSLEFVIFVAAVVLIFHRMRKSDKLKTEEINS